MTVNDPSTATHTFKLVRGPKPPKLAVSWLSYPEGGDDCAPVKFTIQYSDGSDPFSITAVVMALDYTDLTGSLMIIEARLTDDSYEKYPKLHHLEFFRIVGYDPRQRTCSQENPHDYYDGVLTRAL